VNRITTGDAADATVTASNVVVVAMNSSSMTDRHAALSAYIYTCTSTTAAAVKIARQR